MIKSITTYLLTFLVLFVVSYNMHQYIIDKNTIHLRFAIQPIYLFFVLTSLAISLTFLVLNSIQKTREQLGFLYLGTMFLKIMLFVFVFYNSIIKIPSLSKTESLNVLIPLFIFLFLEGYFVVRLLQQNTN